MKIKPLVTLFLAASLAGPVPVSLAEESAAPIESKNTAKVEIGEKIYTAQRKKMVKEQIEERGVKDKKILRAMRKVKRHLFVPAYMAPMAYSDSPIPIGEGQTISQPYIVAYMTEALRLASTDRVLEIGTGSGYQAAVLSELVKEVYSIEIIPELARTADERLKQLGYANVKIKQGDGYDGWKDYQPFDAIIVTAAPETIPQSLLDQLKKPGGRIIAPVGTDNQELILVTQTAEGPQNQKLLPVRFVSMVSWDRSADSKQ